MSLRDRTPTWTRILAGAVVCAMAAFAACSHELTWIDRWLPPPTNFLPRTSPANLLHNLKQAYKERDIEEYDSLLAQDFTFFLSEEDQQYPGMPDSWGHDEEIQIHTVMFDQEYVQTLSLDYLVGNLTWDPGEGKQSVAIQHVNLFLYGATPAHPTDVKEYRVPDSRSKFWFRKNGWLWPGTRDSVWTIVMWKDSPQGSSRDASRASPQSWGAIKHLFLL
jgi:hypothetical protein